MNHAIAVVAHMSRADQAHQLMDDTEAAFLAMDNGTLGCETNHARAWEWLNDFADTEWAVVLEDDAQPVDDFRNQLNQALDSAPKETPIVSLYLGKLRPPHWQTAIEYAIEQATRDDAHYIVGTHLLHAVGVAIRTDLLHDMLDHITTTTHPWDYRIAAWALERGHKVSYLWPSLVEHQDGPTIVRHPDGKQRTPGRTAWNTGTRTTWTDTTVKLNP